MDTFLATVHSLAWAIYLGGALIMELVLRHAQGSMRPSQVAVVCQRAGERYRWFGLASLVILGATGIAMVLRLDDGELATQLGTPALRLSDAYGRGLFLLVVLWAALLVVVALMAFRVHPAMHARMNPGMSEPQIQRERERLGLAIRWMDRLLRTELALTLVALGLGAGLHVGGIF